MFQQQLKKPQQKHKQQNQGQQNYKWNDFHGIYKMKKQQNQYSNRQSIQLPNGTVKITNIQQPILEGWRKLTIQEGKKYKEELKKLLNHWSIVGFETGGLDGRGYGFNIRQQCGAQCGELFVIKPITL